MTIFTTQNKRPINSIVRGRSAGVFVILAHRRIGGEDGYQLKSVNPANIAETSAGEIWLPESAVIDY